MGDYDCTKHKSAKTKSMTLKQRTRTREKANVVTTNVTVWLQVGLQCGRSSSGLSLRRTRASRILVSGFCPACLELAAWWHIWGEVGIWEVTLLLQLGPGHDVTLCFCNWGLATISLFFIFCLYLCTFFFSRARTAISARYYGNMDRKMGSFDPATLTSCKLIFFFRQISLSFVGATEANIADISYRLATTDRQISRYVDVLVPPVKKTLRRLK